MPREYPDWEGRFLLQVKWFILLLWMLVDRKIAFCQADPLLGSACFK